MNITFDESAKSFMLNIFKASTDIEGFIVDEAGEYFPSIDGKPIHINDLAGVINKDGKPFLVTKNIPSLVQASDHIKPSEEVVEFDDILDRRHQIGRNSISRIKEIAEESLEHNDSWPMFMMLIECEIKKHDGFIKLNDYDRVLSLKENHLRKPEPPNTHCSCECCQREEDENNHLFFNNFRELRRSWNLIFNKKPDCME